MDQQSESSNNTGFVVIGRNEGERLKSGLNAIQKLCASSAIVYVDSGSSDDSVAFARSIGIEVVELDLSIPFTAARARNAGFNRLYSINPEVQYVQFMDGDCELLPGWIKNATQTLSENKDIAVVSGRRVEKFPDASIYNTLMDIEWNTPVGETLAVLGDMCVKAKVFKEVGGFSENIIAAEDDDVCLRIRRDGYKIFRLDVEMSRHDANIMHLSQWYRRSKRGGHGYANINHIHGNGPDKYFRRELMSVMVWGGCVPLAFLLFLPIQPKLALAILVLYTMFITKTVMRRLKLGDSFKVALAYGVLIFTGKIPELMGVFEYWKNRLLSRKHQLIEYK
ncbi:glycosyltransferase [Agarilytica rhodophyticola]|uniref:glycosyltransferase n=1 Tax=Agarilytica rhodophyticola TaxID=1737490 RepID=UPI000B341CD4|nr:glycosyltransferase family 2 protein [Agarilytica rhodophyticola]